MLPQSFQDECYRPFLEAYNEMSPWANYDGLSDQWRKLKNDPKVAGHPIFKLLRGGDFLFYKHHPLLNGMMKYHFVLQWHAAGLSDEATTCSHLIMAHVCMGTQLSYPNDPVWPDIEFRVHTVQPRPQVRLAQEAT